MDKSKSTQITYAHSIMYKVLCIIYTALYTLFYTEICFTLKIQLWFSNSATTWDSKLDHVHSYRFRNIWSDSTFGSCVSCLWVFTCHLNIWKFLSHVLQENRAEVGWCWGSQTTVHQWEGIGKMESETKKADETGPQWRKYDHKK